MTQKELKEEFYDRFPCLVKPAGYVFTRDGKKFEIEASHEARGEVWRFIKKALKQQREEIAEKLEEMQQKYFKYITRDGVWSFKFNQYHDHTIDMEMGRELDQAIKSIKQT